MQTYQCPACGAPINFKSSITLYATCEYCTALVIRKDLKLESLGKVARLPNDVSPLQIGTTGKYMGVSFEIIGRLKVAWQKGIWNEWFLLFGNQEEGWLAEAQGMYMMSFEEPYNVLAPAQSDLAVTDVIQIQIDKTQLRDARRADAKYSPSKLYFARGEISKVYVVEDIKAIACLGSEGELPFKAQTGRLSTSVDLTAPNNAFATLEYSVDEGLRYYAGEYVDFDAFAFTNLRELAGWTL